MRPLVWLLVHLERQTDGESTHLDGGRDEGARERRSVSIEGSGTMKRANGGGRQRSAVNWNGETNRKASTSEAIF